ncbi:hypothetical protein DPMN_046349 [Dreissena polymorpha]|uniref:Uncharacterized protein n=2 Tax=Dreissena polymorpha TaxID=45954 RepID=A0A9D4D7R2_DREPO|nr:hypothetical protein DPMN_046349 [Dreissena polymorpha]
MIFQMTLPPCSERSKTNCLYMEVWLLICVFDLARATRPRVMASSDGSRSKKTNATSNLKRKRVLEDRDEDGDTPLHIAVILFDSDFVEQILKRYPFSNCIYMPNKLLQTPLHLAVITDQPRVVRSLVSAGSDKDARDKNGDTPLHICCRKGYVDCIIALLDNNNLYGTTERIDLSLLNYDGHSCLHLAASNHYMNIVMILLKSGADINIKEGKNGRTILHNACECGNTDIVRHLLSYRQCDINAKAYDGLTPYDIAEARRHKDVCLVLAAKGATSGKYANEDV